MIDLAIKHKDELQEKYIKTISNDKYIHYHFTETPPFELKLEESDWNYIERVSISNNNIIGFMSAKANRCPNYISSLSIMAFEDNITFTKDCFDFINYLYKIGMNKILFSCTKSNPAKNIYDKLVKKGRIRFVGYQEKDTILQNGEVCDRYIYEATKKQWESN